MSRQREGVDKLNDDLVLRQSNIQQHDIIRNDRSVDDVFWNGPTGRNSTVQRIGICLFGLLFILSGLSLASVASRHEGAWMGYIMAVLGVGGGCRLIYKSFIVRKTGRESR